MDFCSASRMMTLVNGEVIMRVGIVALLAFSVSTPSFAKYAVISQVKNAAETFEEYNVGDIVTLTGTPTPFLSFRGIVEEENGNKYVGLFNSNPYDRHIGYASFVTVGWHGGAGNDPNPKAGLDTKSTIFSIDVLSQNGGGIFNSGQDHLKGTPFAIIPAGGWHTVAFNQTDDDAAYRFNGPGLAPFKIDNIRYSAITTKIPEPASWMMMIAGFGLVGGAMRGRRLIPFEAR
jgi:hypothetical protein